MRDLRLEIRDDGAMLVEVIALLQAKTPLAGWPADVVAALAQAVGPETKDPREWGKAQRLQRHLFAGAPPPALVATSGVPSRRADRLRADLADLTRCGAGLHLLDEAL